MNTRTNLWMALLVAVLAVSHAGCFVFHDDVALPEWGHACEDARAPRHEARDHRLQVALTGDSA